MAVHRATNNGTCSQCKQLANVVSILFYLCCRRWIHESTFSHLRDLTLIWLQCPHFAFNENHFHGTPSHWKAHEARVILVLDYFASLVGVRLYLGLYGVCDCVFVCVFMWVCMCFVEKPADKTVSPLNCSLYRLFSDFFHSLAKIVFCCSKRADRTNCTKIVIVEHFSYLVWLVSFFFVVFSSLFPMHLPTFLVM